MKQPRLAEFYLRHYAKHLALAMLLQLLVAAAVGGSAWLVYQENWLRGELLILAAAGVFILLELLVISLTLRWFGQPLRILTDAITHVSKEANATEPPNVNRRRYERSGLKALVHTVYGLSVASFQGVLTPESKEVGTPATTSPLANIMRLLPGEVIVLNNTGSISFYHGEHSTQKQPDGSQALRLRFEPADDFTNWLADCRANKVRADRLWKRVPNAVLGEENRRIFDVIAHYEKSNEPQAETVLLLIDRTADYARDDEDMDFIALAAHELRAPITVIRGYLDVLGDELKNELHGDQKELLARVQVSSERLSGYINNILNVSKYDRAHLKLHLHEESIAGMLRELVEDLALRAFTLRRRLTFKIPTGLPSVAADRSSFSEVITNLVDNAIKYSKDEGEIIVSAIMKGDFVELTVQDFGIGMPANVVSNLFTKFYRSHRSRQAVAGTGLGLYISKAIIESHGGKIWVTSTEGQGTTFGIQLPIYATVADKLAAGNNGNEGIIESSNGWIKNHSMYRR